MVNPQFAGGPPTMFLCGSDAAAKQAVRGVLTQFGWDTADMGQVEAARAIEPLCMLWCIPGLARGEWSHAFKLLKPAKSPGGAAGVHAAKLPPWISRSPPNSASGSSRRQAPVNRPKLS
jgi:hypothetical protein